MTLVLDNIRSLYNVGSIFRTADGVGLEKLILTGITPYPTFNGDTRMPWEQQTVSDKLNKTALGAQDIVSWEYVEKYEFLNSKFKKELPIRNNTLRSRPTIVALEKTNTSVSIFDVELSFPLTLIVGNEVTGVSSDILNKSDVVVHLPMLGLKKSLNVANATSIALYELLRQYNKTKP